MKKRRFQAEAPGAACFVDRFPGEGEEEIEKGGNGGDEEDPVETELHREEAAKGGANEVTGKERRFLFGFGKESDEDDAGEEEG